MNMAELELDRSLDAQGCESQEEKLKSTIEDKGGRSVVPATPSRLLGSAIGVQPDPAVKRAMSALGWRWFLRCQSGNDRWAPQWPRCCS